MEGLGAWSFAVPVLTEECDIAVLISLCVEHHAMMLHDADHPNPHASASIPPLYLYSAFQ